MNTQDPLDKAFDFLKARSRERAGCNLDLEERMMQEFSNGARHRMSVVTKAVAVALLCVSAAGAAVAATGGLSRIFNWSGIFETPDGMVYEVENGFLLDDNGDVVGTVDVDIAAE